MQNLGLGTRTVFWCSNCGTLKTRAEGGHEETELTAIMRHVVRESKVRESKIGGVPGLNYHSVVKCLFLVEKPGNGPLKVSVLEIE
jgi:hypothetical protein